MTQSKLDLQIGQALRFTKRRGIDFANQIRSFPKQRINIKYGPLHNLPSLAPNRSVVYVSRLCRMKGKASINAYRRPGKFVKNSTRLGWQLFGVYVYKLNGACRSDIFSTFGPELSVAMRFVLPILLRGQGGNVKRRLCFNFWFESGVSG